MKRGAGWEACLENWHRAYRADRLAWVVKTNPPVKLLQGGAVFSAKGPPDYIGTLVGGRCVVFDAKDTASARWNLAEVKEHQAAHLQHASQLGAFCFIALRQRGAGFVLPWDAIEPLYRAWFRGDAGRGDGSLTEADVRRLGVPMDDEGWLAGVLRLAVGEAA